MTALRSFDKLRTQGERILRVADPRVVAAPVSDGSDFKGLMALLAGIERALVDIDCGLSMHSSSAKNFNMGKAKAALSAGLADFRRGNGL